MILPIPHIGQHKESRYLYLVFLTAAIGGSISSSVMVLCAQSLRVLTLLATLSVTAVVSTSLSPQIPSIASFTPSPDSDAAFFLSPKTRIIVDSKFGGKGSPSAHDFAKTFHDDLASVTSYTDLPAVDLSHSDNGTTNSPSIYIVIDPSLEYRLFNGKVTDEGYDLIIEENTALIKAGAPIGAWRGMTTIVQQSTLAVAAGGNVFFPVGQATDAPGWEIRGFMLDAGRHWFDTQFLSTFSDDYFFCNFLIRDLSHR